MALDSPPFVLQVATAKHSAELFRRAVATLLASNGGIVSEGGGLGYLVSEHVAANMSVNVAAGQAWVPGSAIGQGQYYVRNGATINPAISASDATNPRIEKVVLRIKDAAYAGTENEAVLEVVKGTAEAGATLANRKGAAATPVSSLVLAYVLVPAKATSIVAANIENVASPMTLYSTGAKYEVKTYTKAEVEAGIEFSATRDALVSVKTGGLGGTVTIGGVPAPVPGTAQVRVPTGQKLKSTAPEASNELYVLLL